MELWQLRQRQSLPLEIKEKYTELRIKEWYNYCINKLGCGKILDFIGVKY